MNDARTSYPVYLAFRASEATAEAVRTIADREGKTVSDVIREQLQQLAKPHRQTDCPAVPSLSTTH